MVLLIVSIALFDRIQKSFSWYIFRCCISWLYFVYL